MRKDVTRWRYGDRDSGARIAQNASTTSWRRDIADAAFPEADQAELLRAIRRGVSVRGAAAALGMTYQAVYGRAAWDVGFAEALETTLADTCPAGDMCGRARGVKHGGHCRACRDAHTH